MAVYAIKNSANEPLEMYGPNRPAAALAEHPSLLVFATRKDAKAAVKALALDPRDGAHVTIWPTARDLKEAAQRKIDSQRWNELCARTDKIKKRTDDETGATIRAMRDKAA